MPHYALIRSKNPGIRQGFSVKLSLALVLALLISTPAWPALAAPSEGPRPQVAVIHLDDTVQPVSADFLARGLHEAARQNASAVLIELNTPGGLLSSMRQMVSNILASPIPVIVYVSPSGSRAGSAGFFLLQAADIAAMAPGTNAGAAHPVFEGMKPGATMTQKIENDTEALLRSYVSRRGRNVKLAISAVRESKSFSDAEALKDNLIDIVSPDQASLLDSLDGRVVTRIDGAKTTLHTRDAVTFEIQPTLRERILDRLTNPDLALLILVAGGMLIYVEFSAPGTIVPGALGTVLVLLGLFALNLLPVRYTALMLLVAGFTLLILEVKFVSHGAFALAGIACLVFGSLTLVEGPIPQMRVHLGTALAIGFSFGLISVFLLRLAIRSKYAKTQTGAAGLIGQIAVVTQALVPEGQVMVHGELWKAESTTPAEPGDQVRVRALRDLTLLVERIP